MDDECRATVRQVDASSILRHLGFEAHRGHALQRHGDKRRRFFDRVAAASKLLRCYQLRTAARERIGLTFDAIADQITRVGKRQAQAIVAIPDRITFPSDFQISRQACHKAFRKAIAREPSLVVEEFRKLDTYSGKCLTAPEYSEVLEDFFWRIVKPAADRLGLKYFSSGFEDRFPQWAKRHRRRHRITVSGLTIAMAAKPDGNSRYSHTMSRRSQFRSLVRPRVLAAQHDELLAQDQIFGLKSRP